MKITIMHTSKGIFKSDIIELASMEELISFLCELYDPFIFHKVIYAPGDVEYIIEVLDTLKTNIRNESEKRTQT